MGLCYFCNKDVTVEGKITRRDVCPHCRRDLHCCAQCRFYDPGAHNRCREPLAEPVENREKANLCGYFVFQGRSKGASSDATSAKKALDDLFKKN